MFVVILVIILVVTFVVTTGITSVITSVITSIITFVVTKITTPPHTPYTTNDTKKSMKKPSKNYTNSTKTGGKYIQNVGKYEGVAVPRLSYISLSKKTHKSTIYNPIPNQSKKGGRMATTTPTHYEPKQTIQPPI